MSPSRATEAQVAERSRPLFFDALAKVAPEVLRSLRDEVLPAYLAKGMGARSCMRVLPVLTTWAEAHQLPADPWVFDPALDVLYLWRDKSQSYLRGLDGPLTRWPTGVPYDMSATWPMAYLHFCDRWESNRESREVARRRLLQCFETELNRYLNSEETKIAADWKPVPRRRSLWDHLTWLVMYQVLGMNFSQVARACHVEVRTVSDQVHAAAALIGLTLRPSRPGRPRKRSTEN